MKLKHGRGAIPWMAGNPVAANLLLLFIVVGGLVSAFTIKQEVFPELEMDIIQINVPYPGASPSEVEQGIALVVEEAVRGIDGVKKVSSTAAEGFAMTMVELEIDAGASKALTDIKNAVDRITSLPEDAERPTISQMSMQREVISLVLYGDLDEHSLRALAEDVRNGLLADDEITLVELFGVRVPEISIEISTESLRTYGLTLDGVAREVARESIDLPGGGIKTASGEVLLRTRERRDVGDEFEEIELLNTPAGAKIRLGDVARVVDGFADTDEAALFDGRPAAMVKVFRTGDQTPVEVAAAVKEYVEKLKHELPSGVGVATWADNSELFAQRFDLLLRNAGLGLVLVMLILSLLLEVRLAFWVTIGIPVSFLGSLLLVPAYDVTINMLTLFAFILALGMVVDDAIVVGENVYEYRRRGVSFLKAAIDGARNVAMPVVFSVLTTVAAFMPMFFVPGFAGKMFRQIPAVVISILVVSLVESLFILPAHLAHLGKGKQTGILGGPARMQQRISRLFEWMIEKTYAPVLKRAIKYRYVTIGASIAVLIVTIGFVAGGRIGFSFMPKIESELVTAKAVLPFGTSIDETRAFEQRLVKTVKEVVANNGGDRIMRGIYSQIGKPVGAFGPHDSMAAKTGGSHLATVQVQLQPSDMREISAAAFADDWRRRVGEVAGIESLTFISDLSPGGGAPVDIQLSHTDMEVLKQAAGELAEALESYNGALDIDDGFSSGKPSLDFTLKPEARSLGLTAMDLARQVRSSFFGAEALRQQRGRDELKVMVRLPLEERRSEHDVEELFLRTRDGGEIPITEAADVNRSVSYTEIKRLDGRRVVDVTADVDTKMTSATKILASLEIDVLPDLIKRYPGLNFTRAGQNQEMRESMTSLGLGFVVALVAMFGLLAVPLRSYAEPLFVVMAAIPFGIVGAVIGLAVMGLDLSLIAVMGLVALSGVMVNSSLVLIHAANQFRDGGTTSVDAIYKAGLRRFRPIVLTSVTTFGGLAPMIFETSMQARFLIPMAVTLGFGVLFGTFVTLGVVPAFYMVLEDVRNLLGMRDKSSVLEESLDKADVA
ncbi:MAG: efflux RND transporter permease subunit [Deltaproteobacteria bacterium]|nr:efflux RND transporter permease subunit [Deltaproteobacteria bacterium]